MISSWFYHMALAVMAVVFLQFLVTNVKLSNEGRRRVQHAATGQLLVLISYVLPIVVCRVALSAGILLLLYVYCFCKTWYKRTFGPILRPSERNRLPGAFWFLVGTLVIVTCFNDRSLVRYAVLCLSYADPMAAWIGSSIKSPRVIGRATYAGCIACFMTALVVGWLFLSKDRIEVIIGALACTMAESIPNGNDNLLIPIVTASVLQMLRTCRQ